MTSSPAPPSAHSGARSASQASRSASCSARPARWAPIHLLYSRWGVVSGPGWTDVHVRLPVYVLLGVLTIVAGALPLWSGFLPRLGAALERWVRVPFQGLMSLGALWACVAIACGSWV